MLFEEKYKKIIREAGFDNLLKDKQSNYNNLINQYIEPYYGLTVKYQPEEERKNNLEITVKNLENLYEEVSKVTNKEIINTISKLIIKGKNRLKNWELLEKNNHSMIVCHTKGEYDSLTFRDLRDIVSMSKDPDIDFNIKYEFIIYQGNIYFIDKDNNEIVKEWTILHDEIEYIQIYSFSEDAPEYEPVYRKTSAPINNAAYLDNPMMKKIADDKYQKDLAEYQANLINNEIHNKEQERPTIKSQ